MAVIGPVGPSPTTVPVQTPQPQPTGGETPKEICETISNLYNSVLGTIKEAIKDMGEIPLKYEQQQADAALEKAGADTEACRVANGGDLGGELLRDLEKKFPGDKNELSRLQVWSREDDRHEEIIDTNCAKEIAKEHEALDRTLRADIATY